MGSEKRLLQELKLENGLDLFFYDNSRPIAGDRYYVELLISIPLEIRRNYFEDHPDPSKAYEAFTSVHGTFLDFEQKRIRHFVSAKEVPSLLQQLRDEFLQSSGPYLLKEGFAAKFVRKKYREWVEDQRLKACVEALNERQPG